MKKTLLLFAMLLGVVGAWAQEDKFVTPEVGKYYKLKGDNKAGKPWLTNQLTSNSIVVSANPAEAAIFLKTENGLKDVATGKYLGMNGDLVSLVTNETNVTIGDYNDNNATGHGIKYSVKVSTNYMYNNNTDGKTHESSGWITDIERYWGFIEINSCLRELTIDNFNADRTTWTLFNGSAHTTGWGYKVVTNTTPQITLQREGNTNDLGWSTKNGIRYPYLVRNKTYLITIPEEYKIIEYCIQTASEKNYVGEVSYELSNNQIKITLENGTGNAGDAGVTIRKIVLRYVERQSCGITLSDNVGNQYQGTVEAFPGIDTPPTFTGVEYTLTNNAWDGNQFTADIEFNNLPFPVSSETVANPTMISSYNYNKQAPDQFKWYASDNKIKVKEGEEIFSSSIASHLWLIYPKFNNGAFAFQIKNVATGLFINSSVSSDKHDDESTVILSNEATDFTVGKRGSEGAEFINGFGKRLSVNTSDPTPADKIQTVGTYSSHYGTAVTFPDYMESTTWPEFVSTGTTLNPLVIAIDNDVKKTLVAKKLPSSADRYVHVTASNEEPELGYGQWTIYPAFSGNKIGFKIKNIATDTYIYAKPNGASEEYPVVLNAEGTAFDFAGSKFAYTDGANTLYLSVPANDSYDLQLGVSTEADETRKTITFPEFSSFQVTIGEVGYTTLYSPFTVIAIPEEGKEVDIYAITDATTSENNKVTLTKLESWNVIPANQGCILKGSGKITCSKTDDTWVSGDWSTNLLLGSFTNTYVQGDAYVLSAPDGVESVGLYKALLNKDANGEAGNTHFKNNAGKAYLPASALSAEAAESRFFLFGFGDGEETGITETENGNVKTENYEVYDLSGRRVQGAQKGIFIVNGKKVVR